MSEYNNDCIHSYSFIRKKIICRQNQRSCVPTQNVLRWPRQVRSTAKSIKHVCKALEIGNPTMALARLDDDEKMTLNSTEGHSGQRGGAQQINVINEPGLYSLVLGSRKPEAKAFKRWITHDVVPAIRRQGAYTIDEMLNDPDAVIAALQALKTDRAKKLNEPKIMTWLCSAEGLIERGSD